MSSLWTPSGEHPVEPDGPDAESIATGVSNAPPPDEAADEIDDLRRQLAAAPVEVVIANHCYGLFELAAVHLSQTPPQLIQAQMAIDALGYVVAGLGDRLGEAQASLQEALTQVRLAFVEMESAARGQDGAPVEGDPGVN